MTASDDPRTMFETVVRANQYMVLATADESGLPWVSPVWFATDNFISFLWLSSPSAHPDSGTA